jgi:acyl carrier protein
VLESLDADQVRRVFQPKADVAWHLHELTCGLDLALFVVFSSVAGVLGSAGQAGYAAANGFLDGLAEYRRGRGLPASSMAWGLWGQPSGMTGHLDPGELDRLARAGVRALGTDDGAALFDQARRHHHPNLLPLDLDLPTLRSTTAPLPALLAGLATATAAPARVRTVRATTTGADWPATVSTLSTAEQEERCLRLVQTHAAAVLGHSRPDTIGAREPFKDLGFDSLTAVELRNRLTAATGLAMRATLVFDYPTPQALADHIRGQVAPSDPATRLLDSIAELEAALSAMPITDDATAGVAERLQAMARRLGRDQQTAAVVEQLDVASDDELFSVLDGQFGTS